MYYLPAALKDNDHDDSDDIPTASEHNVLWFQHSVSLKSRIQLNDLLQC